MTPDRWAEVERVYHAALARDVGERVAFLRETCANDEVLRHEVESLLAQSASGGELFYIDGSGLMTSVPVQTTPTFMAGRPTSLFDTRFSSGTGRRYDVTADGKRFLMVKEDPAISQSGPIKSIIVVQHWTDELKRLVPTH